MRVSHWTDFAPASSQIDNMYGGVKGTPELGYTEFNTRGRTFASIAYRLSVAPEHNGYHHFLAMYTSLQGVAYENGCVKKDCRTGFHHICLNFSIPTPQAAITQTNSGPQPPDDYSVTAAQWRETSYRTTFLYGGEIQANDDTNGKSSDNPSGATFAYSLNSAYTTNTAGTPGPTNSMVMTGRVQDLFVLRPSLVHPTNANSRIDLWNVGAYQSNTTGGQQMFFTGIPVAHPRFALNSYTTNPVGFQLGAGTTTWSGNPGNFSMDVGGNDQVQYKTKSINLNFGSGNTVITSSGNIGDSDLFVAASTSGYPANGDTTVFPETVAHTTGTLYMKFRLIGGHLNESGTVTITLTNNSVSTTFAISVSIGE